MSDTVRQRPALAGMMIMGRYAHTGPRVFQDLFSTCGVDRGLLLPVEVATAGGDGQTRRIRGMFPSGGPFLLAGSVPGSITDAEVPAYLADARAEAGVVALKIHPNLADMDLTSAAGHRRWRCLLDAAAALALPVITHVGRSEMLSGPRAGYAELHHLAAAGLDTSVPLVLAHGCGYGIGPDQMTAEGLPLLTALMDRHDHLLVDTSGLGTRQLALLIQAVGPERVLFGSDALYHHPWTAIQALITAVESLGWDCETTLSAILGGNAQRHLFEKHVQTAGGHNAN